MWIKITVSQIETKTLKNTIKEAATSNHLESWYHQGQNKILTRVFQKTVIYFLPFNFDLALELNIYFHFDIYSN